MTTLEPREPYSPAELQKLYPEHLKLQLVQVLLRHGERSPVSARFRNAGLAPFWPYCSAARQLVSAATIGSAAHWGSLQWRRRLETFGPDDGAVIAAGPRGEVDGICNLGELTDTGRKTTNSLGKRLRHLYVDQLHFMPPTIADSDMIYLRATPIPRALESLQETFLGMYPSEARSASFPPPTIVTRGAADETLFPNDSNCRRFAQLSRAFAQRTADRWNDTKDMEYLNGLISKWMPEGSKRVAVDSKPRLSGIMDTVNSTLAHGPETRLPKEFYDRKGRDILEKIGVEEWFSGYNESREYRALGIGGLMGDIVSKMVGSAEMNGNDGILEFGGENDRLGPGRGGEKAIKLGLSGCHDTTLGGILASFGTLNSDKWPPYTSHIAIELFQKKNSTKEQQIAESETGSSDVSSEPLKPRTSAGWFPSLFSKWLMKSTTDINAPIGIARKKIETLNKSEREQLDGFYVRMRYNDEPITIPGCKANGKHLEGDESFCTLEAFKAIVDKYTPSHWKADCLKNLESSAFPKETEPAGY